MTLYDFLVEAVPVLVYKHMVQGRALKVCSGISPDFTEIAAAYGYEAYTLRKPGHVVNVVVSGGRVFEIDLSAIQFQLCAWEGDDEYAESLTRLLGVVFDDPFAAIRVRVLPEIPFDAEAPVGPGRYSKFWNPVESYEWYRRKLESGYATRMDPGSLTPLRSGT